MRSLRPLVFAALCTVPASVAADAIMADSFEPLLLAATPRIELSPGESDTYCYYFRSANRGAVDFAGVVAQSEGIVISASLYATHDLLGVELDRMPPGSVSTIACGVPVTTNDGVTTVATLLAEIPLVRALGLVEDALGRTPETIPPNAPMFLKLTLSNASSETRHGSVKLLAGD